MNGGKINYLYPVDMVIFINEVFDRASEARCINLHDSLEIDIALKRERTDKAQYLLELMHWQNLRYKISDLKSPNRCWLQNTLLKHGIRVCSQQQLEIARRQFCHVESLANFYLTYEPLFHRDARLIFNMYECQLNSARKFKVLCPNGRLPLVTTDEKIPHITAVVTVGAGGKTLKPLIILKKISKLDSVKQFESQCYFGSSQNG
jgi:hypothetical protein